jgi:acyl-coenzyme A thioesterase PaaI-like protein
MSQKVSPAARLLQWWNRLKSRPGGKMLFGRILANGIPYTGTIKPRILAVEPGHAIVQMRDRRALRNHLRSVHAIALANLGELTTGLAMTATLPPDIRSILTALHVEFKKKARGTLTAECRCNVPRVTEAVDYNVTGEVRNAEGDVVAIITATWRLSPSVS